MIAIGGTVFLSIENKVIGASLFSIGLFGVLIYNLNLYTGKIGYLITNFNILKPRFLIKRGLFFYFIFSTLTKLYSLLFSLNVYLYFSKLLLFSFVICV